MATTDLNSLIATFRIIIRDSGHRMSKEQTSVGTTRFWLGDIPIKASSYVVEVDSIEQTDVTDYTLDLDSGELVFTSSVTVDSIVNVRYTVYSYSDNVLAEFLKRAVSNINLNISADTYAVTGTAPNYIVTPSIDFMLEDVLYMKALYALRSEQMSYDADLALIWRDGEKSVNRAAKTAMQKIALEKLDEDIDGIMKKYIMFKLTGKVLSGGEVPSSVSSDTSVDYRAFDTWFWNDR